MILAALDRSPLYTGVIEGEGPRYCPSIEDKVVRFAERVRHQIFVEPEGLNNHELYPNGISTSLPFDVQIELVRASAASSRPTSPVPVTPSNMTFSIPGICSTRWKPKRWAACFLPDR